MSSDTLTAVMLLGSATVACLVAVGAFAVEAFFRRIPLSSAGQTGAISVENGLKLNKENLSANSSFFPKIDVCACLVLFFCAFFFIIPLAMNLDGLPGRLSNLIFLGLSGNAKLPFGGSLFFTIGLGLLLFPVRDPVRGAVRVVYLAGGVPERRGARAVAAVVQFEPDGGGDRRVPLGDLRWGVCDLLAWVRGFVS